MLGLAGALPAAHRADAMPLTCLGCGQEIPHGIGPRCLVCQSEAARPTQTAPNSSTIIVDYKEAGRPMMQPSSAVGYAVTEAPTVRRIRPIDIACPTCSAAAGAECDRRTMGGKRFHFDRVAAAQGAR